MSNSLGNRVLDNEKNILINPEDFPIANLHALDYLPRGLYDLASIIRHKEIKEVERFDTGPTFVYLPGNYSDEVASFFNWFSLSLCNYLRLIALIDIVNRRKWTVRDISKNSDSVKQYCATYTKEIVPEVVTWRNKIAAHPALTDPRKDNVALLQYSVMDSFAFANRYFTAGYMQLASDGHDSKMTPWALTEVYERLAPRFWPRAKLRPLPEFKMPTDEELEQN